MYEIFGENGLRKIKERVKRENVDADIEVEYLERYPFVEENLRERGLFFY